MSGTKRRIIDASIDLFAKHGIKNVSLEDIAEKSKTSRSNVYYHFSGKNAIIDSIVATFDALVQENTPQECDWMDVNCDARAVLSKLFFTFKESDSEKCRKINRIIFCDHHYEMKIRGYMVEQIFHRREENLIRCFNMLIQNGKVKPFDTATAASILNRVFISHALEDSYNKSFKKNELPAVLPKLQNDCMFIVRQILNGHFSE